MGRKLKDVRPCDNCGLPLGSVFYELTVSLAMLDQKVYYNYLATMAVRSIKVAAALLGDPDVTTTLADQEPALGWDICLCQKCALSESISIGELMEAHTQREKAANDAS